MTFGGIEYRHRARSASQSNNAIVLAVLAAPTFNIKAKAPWLLVAANMPARAYRKKLANLCKDTGIGNRVERGVRPIADWSMTIALSSCSTPSIARVHLAPLGRGKRAVSSSWRECY